MRIADLLLPEYDAEIITTRKVLERVPDDRGEWKPHPKAFPMAHLAQLVAMLPEWVTKTMEQTELDIAPTRKCRACTAPRRTTSSAYSPSTARTNASFEYSPALT